ncbi:hypothetical protein OL229_21600 [Neisseriaceae bacterium JH1-16]|nr:hypothetical protein [Neisseriaceae bacterium JH1-16]
MKIVPDLHSYDGELRLPRPSAAHIWNGEEWLFDTETAQRLLEFNKGKLCERIDTSADDARQALVRNPLHLAEYERAANEAEAFKSVDYTGTVPASVKSWADAKGWSARAAADDILAEATRWNVALYSIRDRRLKGKEAVRAASNEVAAQAAADATIADLQHIIAKTGYDPEVQV